MSYEFFNKWSVIFMAKLVEDFDLSVLDAAAIIGNAGHESGGFKSLQEKKPIVKGSRGGYGIMQWTGPRRRAYEAYCEKNKFNPADMDTNYKWLFVELKTTDEGKVLPKLKSGKTLEEKTKIFMKGFLRPGIEHLDSRIIWAKRALAAWNAQPTKPDVPQVPEVSEPSLPETEPQSPTKRSLVDVLLGLLQVLLKILGK